MGSQTNEMRDPVAARSYVPAQPSPPPIAEVLTFGPYRFDRPSGILTRDGDELYLPPRALAVLELFLDRAGQIVSKDELVSSVWHDSYVTDQSPSEAVGVIREVLADDCHTPTYIQTVYRRGYRFIATVNRVQTDAEANPGPRWLPDVLLSPVGTLEASPTAHLRWGSIGLIAGILVASAAYFAWPRPASDPPSPLNIPIALSVPITPGTPPSLAISPDGARIVYRGSPGGENELYQLGLEGFEGGPIPGTAGGYGPFFSPNGESVGFFTEHQLKRVDLRGGPTAVVAETEEGPVYGAAWGPDGTIVFSKGVESGLWRVSSGGGVPEALTTPDEAAGEYNHEWPVFLPGGDLLAFNVVRVGMSAVEPPAIVVLALRGLERRVLLESGGWQPRHLIEGHLVFARAGSLFSLPYNQKTLEITGPAVPIVEKLMTFQTGAAQFDVSASGSLIYVPGELALGTLVWSDRQGKSWPLTLPPSDYGHHRLSPNGQSVIMASDGDIWRYDLARGALGRLTSALSPDMSPLWSPDGNAVVFSSNRSGPMDLYSVPADGSAPGELVYTSDHPKFADSWSPDGRWLVYTELHPETGQDLWILPADGEGEPRPFLRTRFHETQAAFSPDGRWLAYNTDESGRFEIYVRPFPGPGGKFRISTEGGRFPEWSASGDELFFNTGYRIYSVPVHTASEFAAGTAELLFEIHNHNGFYDISPNAETFLLGRTQQSQHPDRLRLIVDARSLLPAIR